MAERTEAKLEQSQSMCKTDPPSAQSACNAAKDVSALCERRFRTIALPPVRTTSLASTYPVPDVVPVTTKTLPLQGGRDLRKPSKIFEGFLTRSSAMVCFAAMASHARGPTAAISFRNALTDLSDTGYSCTTSTVPYLPLATSRERLEHSPNLCFEQLSR